MYHLTQVKKTAAFHPADKTGITGDIDYEILVSLDGVRTWMTRTGQYSTPSKDNWG